VAPVPRMEAWCTGNDSSTVAARKRNWASSGAIRSSFQPSTVSPSEMIAVLPLARRTTADFWFGDMTIPARIAVKGGAGSCWTWTADGAGSGDFGGVGSLLREKRGRSAIALNSEDRVRGGIFRVAGDGGGNLAVGREHPCQGDRSGYQGQGRCNDTRKARSSDHHDLAPVPPDRA
jgi:hypothetical protein